MKHVVLKSKYLFICTGIFLLVAIITGCGTQSENQETQENQVEQTNESTKEEKMEYPTVEENPIVTITMENEEEIKIELYPEIAPNTVANFISLVEDGFYDGLIFHRVIPGFMIQGGDPEGTGMGGPDYAIAGEFESNGFTNDLVHDRGVLSMARSQDPNSAGSQFFIMVADSPHLDGDYASFGQVIEGMETVDAIVAADKDPRDDKPLEDQRMKSVVVDTKGVDYPEPKKQ
ncbi:peptidylprolyl isomerase [Aquibacillus halophilus]|uniref:Peptidyl-prolyl cis-trans isomerase n=1 Tax=Aquibacillus halophilus TaxID=930132 RepID=A0A6A8DRT0_9BACI|nr:peptidylprolyl isomerase [Aquibacillus halophilus]MRH43922.1 peptidylprolyl isomerase [Aquibacillus halophilus]